MVYQDYTMRTYLICKKQKKKIYIKYMVIAIKLINQIPTSKLNEEKRTKMTNLFIYFVTVIH